MAVFFLALAVGVVLAAALALAGRWRPEPLSEAIPAPQVGFDVVLRGYRMEQVDMVIDAMQGELDGLRRQAGEGGTAEAGAVGFDREGAAANPGDVSSAR